MGVLPLILLSVLINTAAQICLKQGMNKIGYFNFSIEQLANTALKVALNPYILGGMLCYITSVVVWLLVLSRAPVSYAYPMVSLGYITTCIAAVVFFNEILTLTRILGIFVIIAGVYLISKG